MLKGIDISEHQGRIRPDEVAANVDFAVVRASYGITRVDLQGWANRTFLRERGVLLAHYHYAVPQASSPIVQARAFLDSVGWMMAGEPLALDLEEEFPDLTFWAWNFAQIVLNASGRPPFIYTNADFINRYNFQSLVDMGCPLWKARWGENESDFHGHGPWLHNAIHQYSSSGAVSGIDGNVDMNSFDGDAQAWRDFGSIV